MAGHGRTGSRTAVTPDPDVGCQQADYVVRRLQEYRAGTNSERHQHLFNIMGEVTKSLIDEEIDSLGSDLQGLHERPDASTLIAMANAPAAAAAPAAEPAPEIGRASCRERVCPYV